MTKMTKKDGILLTLVLLITASVLIYLLFTSPQMKKNDEQLAQLTILRDENKLLSDNLARLSENMATITRLTQEFEDTKEQFAFLNKSYNVHYAFTQTGEKSGISLKSMSIGDLVEFNLIPLPEGAPPPTEEEEKAKLVKTYRQTVSLTFTGTLEQALSYVDAINDYADNFTVKSFSTTDLTDDEPPVYSILAEIVILQDNKGVE